MIETLLFLSAFFLLALMVQAVSHRKLCALCGAVTATWIVLLYQMKSGSGDPLLVGILMGGSAVGGLYYLFSKFSEEYYILKFPYLLSAIWIVYRIIRGFSGSFYEFIFVGAVWIIFGTILLFYKNKKWREVGKRIVECCKNW